MFTKSILLYIILLFICGSKSTRSTFLLCCSASICAIVVTLAVFPTPPLLFKNIIVFIILISFLILLYFVHPAFYQLIYFVFKFIGLNYYTVFITNFRLQYSKIFSFYKSFLCFKPFFYIHKFFVPICIRIFFFVS